MAKNKQQIKFEADISGFKSAIKDSEKQIASLNKELKLNSEQLKGNSKSVDLLQTKLKELQDKYKEQTDIVENTGKALETAKETFGENSEEAQKWSNKLIEAQTAQQKIKNAIDETTEQLKKQTSGWVTHGQELQKSGEKIEKVGEKLDKLGNKVSIISAGVGAGLVATSKAAIDYESAFAGVIKTVDGTEEQLQAINDGILEMSTRMPAAATEIASVAESAGQLGIKTDDILNFSEVMINLGESTNLSANEAASSLAKFANITNMSADDYGRLGSVIVDLGNNFATTEADIVAMSTRLAATGDLAGLSQSQIMAIATAMSSVGIEAEAGGSAMSKLLKKIQVATETGGKDLKKFADVAGVSSSEFKKAFEEDAVNALTMFLQGLNDTERNGKSAIGVLDDMGLKEVRLSNTILSLSNASGVLTDAVDTANKAWDTNSALQNEVNKRYATSESQIKMLKNEAKKLAVEFGRELLPVLKDLLEQAKPILKNVGDGIKKFSSLDDKTKKTVITIAGFVTAAGPLIKVTGNITSGVGKAISAFGKFSESSMGLKGVLSKLTTPLGLVTIGVTAAAVAWEYFSNQQSEVQKHYDSIVDDINKAKQAQDDYNNSINQSTNSELAHIARIQELKNELTQIVDENGQVKEGYEKRASFILNELNNALGTEYSMNNNIIESYKEISNEIDKLIEKKQADIVLAGSAKKWEQAYNDQQNAIIEQEKAYSALEDYAKFYGITVDEFVENIHKADEEWTSYHNHTGKYTEHMSKYNKAMTDEGLKLIDAYDTAEKRVKTNQENMDAYNKKLVDYTNGDYDKVVDIVTTATNTYTDYSLQKLTETIHAEGKELKDYTHSYDTTQAELAAKQREIAQTNLKSLAEELATRTQTIHELSTDEVMAWRVLANESYDAYQQGLSQVPEEMRKKIEEATGVVYEMTPDIVQETQNMSQQIIDKLDNDEEFRKEAVQSLNSFLDGLSNSELRDLLQQAGVDDVDKVMKGIREGDIAEDEGVEILKSLHRGLENESWTTTLFGKARTIANTLSSLLNVSPTISSTPKTSNADGLAYVPYNGYVARLHEGERVLTKAENADYMANRINNNNNNVTVNIYPQTMTEGEMAKVSRYIERSWGKKS